MKGTEKDLEVPLKSDLPEIYKKFHDNVSDPGMNATVHAIQQQYTWKGMYKDIEDYVSVFDYVNLYYLKHNCCEFVYLFVCMSIINRKD